MLKTEANNVIEPQYLAIHVTYRCPARCDHCCFSSDPYKHGALDVETVLKAIDEASKVLSLKLVGFTGGDPFLHADILAKAIGHAKSYGLGTRVVTSAYWASSETKAFQSLQALASIGLDEITISYDDSHAPFVKERNIVNAYLSARRLGILTAVNVCIQPSSKITKPYIENLLSAKSHDPEALLIIYESWINSTGRAFEEPSFELKNARKSQSGAYRGPCPHVLRGPTITPSGQILACCGVIPFREGLQIGTVGEDTIGSALSRAYSSPVLKWIAFEGPVSIMKQITANTDDPVEDASFDGICNACDVMFSTPEYTRLLRDALPKKSLSLKLQEFIYSEAGLFKPPF